MYKKSNPSQEIKDWRLHHHRLSTGDTVDDSDLTICFCVVDSALEEDNSRHQMLDILLMIQMDIAWIVAMAVEQAEDDSCCWWACDKMVKEVFDDEFLDVSEEADLLLRDMAAPDYSLLMDIRRDYECCWLKAL